MGTKKKSVKTTTPNITNSTSPKRQDEQQEIQDDLDRYERIVDRAHDEFQYVRSHYKWLFGSITASVTVIIAVGCIVGAFLIRDNLNDMREDIRSQVDIVARDVQSRIDQEFNKENITKLIETAAKTKVEEIAVPRIRQDVNEIIIPKIEVAEEKLLDINDLLLGLENRVAKTDEEQKLLSEDITVLRLFFDVRRGQREAFEKLQDIADKSNGKKGKLAEALLEDITFYYEDFKFKTFKSFKII